jgi:hypothetical protein
MHFKRFRRLRVVAAASPSAFILVGLGALASASASAAPSIVGNWAGRWDYYPSACGGSPCSGSDYFENLTFTSQVADGGGAFTVTGDGHACGPGGCYSFSWDSGTLVGDQLTLLTDATSSNSYKGYELIVDLTNGGNSLLGNMPQGVMDGAYGWVPVGTGFGFSACPDTGCTSPAETGAVVAAELADTSNYSVYFPNTYTANRVPEPATLALMGMGLLGLGLVARGRRARDQRSA